MPCWTTCSPTAQSLGIKVVRRWEGEEFDFGGAHAQVLYPARDAVIADKARNNDSMVLRASYGDTSLLLEGDAEKTVERYVTARHQPTATLLKVGHHGSTNATTAELVSAARPAFAVISVGAGNSFALPRTETLSRLERSRRSCVPHRSGWGDDLLSRRTVGHGFCSGSSVI